MVFFLSSLWLFQGYDPANYRQVVMIPIPDSQSWVTTLFFVNVERLNYQGLEHGLIALDPEGKSLGSVNSFPKYNGTLNLHGYYYGSIAEIFGNPNLPGGPRLTPEEISRVSAVRFESNQVFVIASYAQSQDGSMLDTELGLEYAQPSLFFPHVPNSPAQWNTHLNLATGPEGGQPVLELGTTLYPLDQFPDLRFPLSNSSLDLGTFEAGGFVYVKDEVTRLFGEIRFEHLGNGTSVRLGAIEPRLSFRVSHVPSDRSLWWDGHVLTNPGPRTLRLKITQFLESGEEIPQSMVLSLAPYQKIVSLGEDLGREQGYHGLDPSCSHFDVISLLPNQNDLGDSVGYLDEGFDLNAYRFGVVSLFGTRDFTQMAGINAEPLGKVGLMPGGPNPTSYEWVLPVWDPGWNGLVIENQNMLMGATQFVEIWGFRDVLAGENAVSNLPQILELNTNQKWKGLVSDVFGETDYPGPKPAFLLLRSDQNLSSFMLSGKEGNLAGLNAFNNGIVQVSIDYRIDGIGEVNDDILFDVDIQVRKGTLGGAGSSGPTNVVLFDLGDGIYRQVIRLDPPYPKHLKGIYRFKLPIAGTLNEIKVKIATSEGSFLYSLGKIKVDEEKDYDIDALKGEGYSYNLIKNKKEELADLCVKYKATFDVNGTAINDRDLFINNYLTPMTDGILDGGEFVSSDMFDDMIGVKLRFKYKVSTGEEYYHTVTFDNESAGAELKKYFNIIN